MNSTKNLVDLQLLVTKTILIASCILFFAILVNDFFLGFTELAMIKIVMIFIYLWALYKLNKIGFQEHYAHFVFVPLLVFFIINYLTNQGTDGPTVLGCLGVFVAYQVVLSRFWSIFYSLLTILAILTLLYVGTDKQNLIVADYANPQQRLIDYSITFIAMAVYITLMVGMVLHYYRNQNEQLFATQKQLKDHIILVEAKKKQKENLLGILAHDVRNPVYNLGQLITLYQENALKQADLTNLLGHMQVRITDLQSTIESILDQIRMDLDKHADGQVKINPIEATGNLVQTLNYKFELKHQKIVFEHPTKVKYELKYGQNANEVTIIIKNLLDNASKYSPEGGQITVRLFEVESRLQWDILDEGQGISAEIQKILFSKDVKSKNGAGVGLFLCKSIADTIGAELTYIPQPKGSLFRLAVPCEV